MATRFFTSVFFMNCLYSQATYSLSTVLRIWSPVRVVMIDFSSLFIAASPCWLFILEHCNSRTICEQSQWLLKINQNRLKYSMPMQSMILLTFMAGSYCTVLGLPVPLILWSRCSMIQGVIFFEKEHFRKFWTKFPQSHHISSQSSKLLC